MILTARTASDAHLPSLGNVFFRSLSLFGEHKARPVIGDACSKIAEIRTMMENFRDGIETVRPTTGSSALHAIVGKLRKIAQLREDGASLEDRWTADKLCMVSELLLETINSQRLKIPFFLSDWYAAFHHG